MATRTPPLNGDLKPFHLVFATIGAVVLSAGAVWGMVSAHTHEEYVPRGEVEILKQLMQSEHAAIRRELQNLRQSLDTK